MKLILASKSPRRREILSMVTDNFEVKVSGADETVDENLDPTKIPEYLSKIKAEAIPLEDDEVVIGSDTIVLFNNTILGKPQDKNEAVSMLKMLSGTEHLVISGITVLTKEKTVSDSVTTVVKMRELDEGEILSYVNRFCPTDKAGAYGIQEMAGAFVEEIRGDYYNVVGLPLCRLVTILKEEFNVDLIK